MAQMIRMRCLTGLALSLLLFTALGGCVSGQDESDSFSSDVTTVRDTRGVWYVSGSSRLEAYDVWEAVGYATAEDRLWQAELYRRTGRGRLAAILGPDFLPADILMRTLGYSDQELEEGWNDLSQKTRDVISGYVAGFNRRIADVAADPSLVPLEFAALNFLPDPWTHLDVLAWSVALQRQFDIEASWMDGGMTGQLDNIALLTYLTTAFPQDGPAMFSDLSWIDDPAAYTMLDTQDVAVYYGSGISVGMQTTFDTTPFTRTGAHASAVAAAVDAALETFEAARKPIQDMNVTIKMGSKAWVVSGDKTASGNPILFAGPAMGHDVPSIIHEGAVNAGGWHISGAAVAGAPGFIVGRTPHHAWSMQVGHAHTVDYYLLPLSAAELHRMETIQVAGQAPVTLPVFRTQFGPVISPLPLDPAAADPAAPIVAWRYSGWGYELQSIETMHNLAAADSMEAFGDAVKDLSASMHICYADKNGNIAYWMSGRNPQRPAGDYRFPQGFNGPPQDWDEDVRVPVPHGANPVQGFYGGWNNKSEPGYFPTAFNFQPMQYGPFFRGQMIYDYFAANDDLTFEQVRDFDIRAAASNTFANGDNAWSVVADRFMQAVEQANCEDHAEALEVIRAWDGQRVPGGVPGWIAGDTAADGSILTHNWMRHVLELTFKDELGPLFEETSRAPLFNALLHGLAGDEASLPWSYNWFSNNALPDNPQTADEIIVAALDLTLTNIGPFPWNFERGEIHYVHPLIGELPVTTPWGYRTTYTQVVEMGPAGPVRIESMFAPGQSGQITPNPDGSVTAESFPTHFFSMMPLYNGFAPRSFPLFGQEN